MARGRVYTSVPSPRYETRGRRMYFPSVRFVTWRLMVAEVHDSAGRLVWSDNTRFSVDSHARMLAMTAEVVAAVRLLESLGHRLEWDWQECGRRAPDL